MNSVNEFRLEGQKTAAFELLEDLDERLDALCIPVGNAGNITAYWKGFVEAGAAPRLFGFQAAGAAPLVSGAPVERPRDGRQRDPDRQPGALGGGDRRDDAPRAGRSAPSPTRRSSPPTACWPRRGGVLRAGLGRHPSPGCSLRRRRRRTVACVLTGHGLKDPDDRARAGRRGRAVRAAAARDRARGARVAAMAVAGEQAPSARGALR